MEGIREESYTEVAVAGPAWGGRIRCSEDAEGPVMITEGIWASQLRERIRVTALPALTPK